MLLGLVSGKVMATLKDLQLEQQLKEGKLE
jgi:hypothetical protein